MEKILAGRLRSTDPMAPSVDSAFSTRAGRAAGCADRKRPIFRLDFDCNVFFGRCVVEATLMCL